MPTYKYPKTEFVKNLINRHKYVTHLDEAFKSFDGPFEFKHTEKGTDDAWHPSGHCLPSPLELYHAAQPHAPAWEPSIGLRKAFMVGYFWHQLLQHITVETLGLADWDSIERHATKHWGEITPVVVDPVSPEDTRGLVLAFPEAETNVQWAKPQPYHWVSGSADVAPLKLPKHGDFLVDYKTMGAHDFKKNGLPDWCAEKYEAQINVYMSLFDIDQAMIVAVLKDTPHDFKEICFDRNQDLIDTIFEKWHFVSECLTEGIEPDEEDDFILNFTGPVA